MTYAVSMPDAHDSTEVHVVHSVGPDLRKPLVSSGTTRPFSRDEAVATLSTAYMNTFREFLESGQYILRLLPISGGIFAVRKRRFPNSLFEDLLGRI